jgi:hypothetical protein
LCANLELLGLLEQFLVVQESTKQLHQARLQIRQLQDELVARVTLATRDMEALKQEIETWKAHCQKQQRAAAAEQAKSAQLQQRVQEQTADVQAMVSLLGGGPVSAAAEGTAARHVATSEPGLPASAPIKSDVALLQQSGVHVPVSAPPFRKHSPPQSCCSQKGREYLPAHDMARRAWQPQCAGHADAHQLHIKLLAPTQTICGSLTNVCNNIELSSPGVDQNCLPSQTSIASMERPVVHAEKQAQATHNSTSSPTSAWASALHHPERSWRQEIGTLHSDIVDLQMSLSNALTMSEMS